MKKQILSLLLLLCLLLNAALPVFAEQTDDVSAEGNGAACGDTLNWSINGTTLTISGTGEMYDFESGNAPWQDFKDTLTTVVLEGGVTHVGAYAFTDFDKLISVDFGSSLVQIGAYAFSSCDALTSVSLPKTFKKFGERCFNACRNLTHIHCAGSFPRFDDSCLWNTYCKIYFPKEAPWSVQLIAQLEEAFAGRIEFLASDGSDPYIPTEPTTAPTTVPTTAPTTAPTAATVTEAEVQTVPETTLSPTQTTEPAASTETEPVSSQTTAVTQPETQTATQKEPQKVTLSPSAKLAIAELVLCIVGFAALIVRIIVRRR